MTPFRRPDDLSYNPKTKFKSKGNEQQWLLAKIITIQMARILGLCLLSQSFLQRSQFAMSLRLAQKIVLAFCRAWSSH